MDAGHTIVKCVQNCEGRIETTTKKEQKNNRDDGENHLLSSPFNHPPLRNNPSTVLVANPPHSLNTHLHTHISSSVLTNILILFGGCSSSREWRGCSVFAKLVIQDQHTESRHFLPANKPITANLNAMSHSSVGVFDAVFDHNVSYPMHMAEG